MGGPEQGRAHPTPDWGSQGAELGFQLLRAPQMVPMKPNVRSTPGRCCGEGGDVSALCGFSPPGREGKEVKGRVRRQLAHGVLLMEGKLPASCC